MPNRGKKRHVRGPFCTVPDRVIKQKQQAKAARRPPPPKEEEAPSAVPTSDEPKLTHKLQLGKKRAKKFEQLKSQQTFFTVSEKSADELVKVGASYQREVEHAVANCFEELHLRKEFRDDGVGHKFFSSGKYKLRYMLSCDGIPVTQIIKVAKY